MYQSENRKRLVSLFQVAGLPAALSSDQSFIELHTEMVYMSVQERPGYCDRGRWLVLVDSKDQRKLTIDAADGFPRYYFGDRALVSEMLAWLLARNQIKMTKEEQDASQSQL